MSVRLYLEGMRDEVNNFLRDVNDSLSTMRSMKGQVKDTHKNCNISKTVGTSVNGVGTIGLLAGILFPPAAIVGGIALVAGTATNITTEAIRDDKNDGYGNKLKRVAEKINEHNKRLKSIAEKWKDYGDGDSKSSDVCCLRQTDVNLCDIQQVETFANRLIARGAIVAASAALARSMVAAGIVRLAAASGVASCLLIGYDIYTTVSDWNRDPPMQDDIDKFINELLRMKEVLETYKRIIVRALAKL